MVHPEGDMSIPNFMAIHLIVLDIICLKPQCHGGARGEVRGIPTLLGYDPQISVSNSLPI